MATFFGSKDVTTPITNAILDACVNEIKKKENRDKIVKDVLEPIVQEIANKYYPHFVLLTTMLFVVIILLGLTLALLMGYDPKRLIGMSNAKATATKGGGKK